MTWWRLLLAAASGLALHFTFPPSLWESGVWWSLIPLVALLWMPTHPRRFRRGFLEAYVAGFAFFLPNFAWIRHSSRVVQGASDLSWMGWAPEAMGWAVALVLALYLALFWGFWGGMVAKFGALDFSRFQNLDGRARYWSISLYSLSKAFWIAAAWVGMEWLRGWLFTGFGWNGLGVAMAPYVALIQVAEWIGVTGLSFLPVFVSAIAVSTLLRFRHDWGKRQLRPYADFLALLLLLIGLASFGAKRLVQEDVAQKTLEAPTLSLLLVQPNLGQQDKWNPEMAPAIYQDLARLTEPSARGGNYDLIVWPESAVPYDFHDPNHIDFLNDVLSWGSYSLLTGCDINLPGDPVYTGAALMQRSFEQHQLYRKVHLVPFGEYLPLRFIPLVDSLLGGALPGDFAHGASTDPLPLPNRSNIEIVPLVCFEDSVGRLARRFVRSSAQLLVNMTNDGWFLQSHQNELHLTNALFRCIELRRPMARACNTGVTCFIDVTGRIQKGQKLVDFDTQSPFVRGVLSGRVKLTTAGSLTFYAQYGDVFSITLLGLSSLLLVLRFRSKERNEQAAKSI